MILKDVQAFSALRQMPIKRCFSFFIHYYSYFTAISRDNLNINISRSSIFAKKYKKYKTEKNYTQVFRLNDFSANDYNNSNNRKNIIKNHKMLNKDKVERFCFFGVLKTL